MKKFLALFFVFMILISGCSKKLTEPSQEMQQDQTAVQSADKINDTTYAGRVTEITDETITIIMDEKTNETFNLNERARNDIRILQVDVDKRVIINFESAESREITGIEVITSE